MATGSGSSCRRPRATNSAEGATSGGMARPLRCASWRQADDRPDFDVRAHRGLHRQHRENFELEPVDCPERAI